MLALVGLDRVRRVAGRAVASVASSVGLVVLATAVAVFDRYTPTPGMYALLPTVGALLLIAFAAEGTWAHRLLTTRWLVGVGLVSYSAYLWHQPLFAFARLRTTHEPGPIVFGLLAALSLALAYLTWRFVEMPFRRATVVPRRMLAGSVVAGFALLLLGVAGSEATGGFRSRIPAEDLSLAAVADTVAQERYALARFVDLNRDFEEQTPARVNVLVVGDSYAQDFVNAMHESGNDQGAQVRTYYFRPECQIYVGRDDVSEHIEPQFRSTCEESRAAETLRRRVADADVVILAASWRAWAVERLGATIGQLGAGVGPKTYVVGPKRVGDINIRELLELPREARVRQRQPVSQRVVEMDRLIAQSIPQGHYVSMQKAVCGFGENCALFTPDGDLISFDGTHLTRLGAKFAGHRLFAEPPLAGLVQRIGQSREM